MPETYVISLGIWVFGYLGIWAFSYRKLIKALSVRLHPKLAH
jgi:hypothetical protein